MKTSHLVAIFAAVFVFVAFSIGIRLFGGLNIEYGDGERSGVVYKISKKGYIWKTWEGELNIGITEVDAEGSLIPKIFYFSVSDENIAQELRKANLSGKRVTLKYKEYLLRGINKGMTPYDIVGVEF